MNIQDWFSLGLPVLISLLSMELSWVFSSTAKYLFFNSSRSFLKYFFYNFLIRPFILLFYTYFFPKILDHLYYHYSQFFFRRLLIFYSSVWSFEFCHVASSSECCCVFSFCSIYCVWFLLSANWKFIVPLSCEDCPSHPPPWVWLDQCLVNISLLEGLVLGFCQWSWI